MRYRTIILSAIVVATIWTAPAEAGRPSVASPDAVTPIFAPSQLPERRHVGRIEVADGKPRRPFGEREDAPARPIRDWRALLHRMPDNLTLHGSRGDRADGRIRPLRVNHRPAAVP